MDPLELNARSDELQLVDVRQLGEWEAGRIDSAVHIPLDVLGDRLDELDRSRPVVTVCRSGERSQEAAEQLVAAGFDAENLDGGMLAWAAARLPVTTPDGAPGTVAEPESSGPDDGFEAELVGLGLEIDEHFGGRQASEEEVRGYLRDRMISEGRSPEEADDVLARIERQPPHSEPPAPK